MKTFYGNVFVWLTAGLCVAIFIASTDELSQLFGDESDSPDVDYVSVDFGPLEEGPPDLLPPQLDSRIYEFEYEVDEATGVYPGVQSFGSMDKVGVNKAITSSLGDISADVEAIGFDNHDRETYLLNQETEISPDLLWHVTIENAVSVGEEVRYEVYVLIGRDQLNSTSRLETGVVAGLCELWQQRLGEEPLLLHRGLNYLPPDTVIP